ncbi:carboxylating nicotinate-nucleotide diphosphorylase [Nakamurella sp. GG22]
MGLTEQTRLALAEAGLAADEVAALIDRALSEDLRDGPDVTTDATVPADQLSVANITPRSAGVLAGGPVAMAVFETVSFTAEFEQLVAEGGRLIPGVPALAVAGPTAGILTAERTALNLLTHLSGIATATRAWVDAVAGTDARIRDTRKTLPGLRLLEKYAVRCGGGVNHRMSLGDAPLIKDNHVAAAGSVHAAIEAVRSLNPSIPLEVEVDNLDQLAEAIAAGAELVLLDNFSTADTVEAVSVVRSSGRPVLLEASGGLSLDRAGEVAATGVDFLAVGALTHSAPALDLGLDLVAQPLP